MFILTLHYQYRSIKGKYNTTCHLFGSRWCIEEPSASGSKCAMWFFSADNTTKKSRYVKHTNRNAKYDNSNIQRVVEGIHLCCFSASMVDRWHAGEGACCSGYICMEVHRVEGENNGGNSDS